MVPAYQSEHDGFDLQQKLVYSQHVLKCIAKIQKKNVGFLCTVQNSLITDTSTCANSTFLSWSQMSFNRVRALT